MGFPRQEYWSGLPFPSPGDLPESGMEPGVLYLLHWQANSITGPPGKPEGFINTQIAEPRPHPTPTVVGGPENLHFEQIPTVVGPGTTLCKPIF